MDDCREMKRAGSRFHGAALWGAGLMGIVGMMGCVDGAEPVELGEREQALTACSMEGSASFRCRLPGFQASPAEWWQDSGIDVAVGDRLTLGLCTGSNLPWGGHEGFGCAGSATTFWTEALSNVCTFGSLVGRVGTTGPIYCIGNNTTFYPSTAGRLYLAFNDGVSFADNDGQWTATFAIGKRLCETLQAQIGDSARRARISSRASRR